MSKGMTRPRKKGSKQPKPWWKRVDAGDGKERWVHPATLKKMVAYGGAGLAAGILGYFLPGILYSLFTSFILGFLKDFKNEIADIFKV